MAIIVANERRRLERPQSKEKEVGRRGFLKVALGVVAAVVAAATGLILLRKQSQQPSVTPPPEHEQTAQLVLVNGKIITVDSNDSIAQAVAVDAGKMTKVGTDEEVRALIGESTQVIDLKGKTVTPGLIDAHCHLGGGCAEKYYLDLRPGKVGSIADIVKLVARKVEETPSGEWILGLGWRSDGWSEHRLPNRLDLDPVSPNHPVFLTDTSGWYGWANSYGSGSKGTY